MKKQTRIRRNGSPRAAAPQAKTPTASQVTFAGRPGACIALFDIETGKCVEDNVYLSHAELDALKQSAKASGNRVLRWMANAGLDKTDKVKNPTKEAKYTDEAQCWCELEFSVQQAIGCIHLLDERLGQMLALNSIEEESSQAAGIFHIASQTSERLYRAFHASFKMYHPKAAHEA